MAHIDMNELQEYPFTGEFYKSTIDTTKPLTDRKEVKVVIAQVVCDIQEDKNSRVNATAKTTYEVYVPFDGDEIPVEVGHMFSGTQYGLLVAGKVIGVFPSQVGTGFDGRRGYLARVETVDV